MFQWRVYFYTEDDVMFAWYTAKSKEEAQGLRRVIKNGYAKIEKHFV